MLEWCEAMEKEITALEENGTCTLTDLPPNKRSIGCKYVYKVKYNADGSIERCKARFVTKGYTQKEGINNQDIFSRIAKLTTMRILLTVAVKRKWFMEQLDINNAFLYGSLDKELYMHKPPGYKKRLPHQVYKLNKVFMS